MVDTEDTVERDLPKPTMDTAVAMEAMVAMEVMVDTEDTVERDQPTPTADMEVMVVVMVAMEAMVVDTDMAVNTKFSTLNIPNTFISTYQIPHLVHFYTKLQFCKSSHAYMFLKTSSIML